MDSFKKSPTFLKGTVSMREQDKLRIDRFCNRSPEEELLRGDQPLQARVATLNVNFERSRLAERIATCSACLLLLSVLLAAGMLASPAASSAEVAVGISITVAPPPLPVYVQPPIPGLGYIWTPGYWAWDPETGDYYWVPGTWVLVPFPGALWTPGYWGWRGGIYVWNAGYWGPVVGFYGGINYGFGYFGRGYEGGYWRRGAFYYNRTVNNVTVNIKNVYRRSVVTRVTENRVSFNGGTGGITARATEKELAAARQRRAAPTDAQTQHERTAQKNPKQRAAVNKGKPAVAASPKPGEFTGRDVVPASRAGGPEAGPKGREKIEPSEKKKPVKPQVAPKGPEKMEPGEKKKPVKPKAAPKGPEKMEPGEKKKPVKPKASPKGREKMEEPGGGKKPEEPER
jgi:hypothetical protein